MTCEPTNLTLKQAFNLAGPHTWPASILPCLVGICVCSVQNYCINIPLAAILLLICIFMQSSVNTFNDYFDYIKGSDSVDDNLEPDDNVLAYYHVNPKHVLVLAIAYLVIPFALGAYLIYLRGIIPLVIALVGAFFVVFYSAGKTPVSYLPIGEFVSGFVMGDLIVLGTYSVLCSEFSLLPLIYGVPTVIGVGLIMQTNNTCDIEKDIESNRRTMPSIVGREKSRTIYHVLLLVWLVSIVIIVCVCFTRGVWVTVVMLLAAFPIIKGLWLNPLLPQTRIAAMGAICSVNVVLGSFYSAAILASVLPIFIIA